VVAGLLGAYPAAFGGDQAGLLLLLGATAVLLTVVAASGLWVAAAAWGLGVLGLEYIASLYLAGEGMGVGTPIYAALMLLVGELVYLAAQLEARPAAGEPLLRRRLGLTGGLVLLSLLAGSVLLGLGLVPVESGVPLTALGMTAAVAALGLTVAVARR
jgi:hypothetical protein